MQDVTTQPAGSGDPYPFDMETIRASIVRALRADSSRLDPADLADLQSLLRGHIALLLPSARAPVDRPWHGDGECSAQKARVDAINRQLGERTGDGSPFMTLAHVQILVRDCQWLYAVHMAAQR